MATLGSTALLVKATTTDSLGNVYLAGNFYDSLRLGSLLVRSQGQLDGFVAKWNTAAAKFEWARAVAGPEEEEVLGVAVQGRCVYVVAQSSSSSISFGPIGMQHQGLTGNENAFVAKLIDAGPSTNFTWVQAIGGDGAVVPFVAAHDTCVYVGGSFYRPQTFGGTQLPAVQTGSTGNGFLAKLVDTGPAARCEWGRPLGTGLNGLAVQGASIYCIGAYTGTAGEFGSFSLPKQSAYSSFVVKFTDTGTQGVLNWSQRLEEDDYYQLNGLAVWGSNVYVGGSFFGRTFSVGATTLTNADFGHGTDIFLAKLTDAGTSVGATWALRAGGTGQDECKALAINETGLYMTGTFTSNPATFGTANLPNVWGEDLFITQVQDAGSTADFTWARRIGSPANDKALTVAAQGAHVYVTGSLSDYGQLNAQTTVRGSFLAELAAVNSSSVATVVASSPASLFPNPAQGSVVISLPPQAELSAATLLLYDTQGRLLRQFTCALPPGALVNQSLALDELAAGLYILRVQLANNTTNYRLQIK